MSGTHKIKIAARLRPRIEHEIDDQGIQITHDEDGEGPSWIRVPNPRDATQVFRFPFTSCYDQDSTQEEIFEQDVRPLIDVVYSGVTVTIFAYGVTSSGKTHTMQGTRACPGVIPRVVEAMFEQKAALLKSNVELAVSYMEIYKDECYDLLVDRETAPKLPVRENDVGQVFVANLSSIPIASVEEFVAIYSQASKHRSVGATNLNRSSSRSHAMLTLEVTMTDSSAQKSLTGKINLVDLAGSENNKLTGNDPTRMAESSAINKSLSVLGQVVHALNQGASRIPYRNSKLTRILQDALGGNSVGLLICNLAPGTKFRQDTLNTLNFAVRTKNVENRPVVNERDIRPQPKPHFAAILPPPPKLAPAVLQPLEAVAGPSRGPRPSIARAAPRASLAGAGQSRSRVPRASGIGVFGGHKGRRPSGVPALISEKAETSGNFSMMQLTDKEIDERIARAVEVEVARRLKEREELDRQEKENNTLQLKLQKEKEKEKLKEEVQRLPAGVLSPLMAQHRDLDHELRVRLEELEEKYERGTKELQLADVLSPVSRKKTGRAYVMLARAHSEKGDLQVALDLYRKAETYVPDNVKLKERVIEIEWAVKNGTTFIPSPKKPRKAKKTKAGKRKAVGKVMSGDEDEEDLTMDGIHQMLGGESSGSANPLKRFKVEEDVTQAMSATPQKRVKCEVEGDI
ncbi:P-loop containing nucleoside triphosphate hydrolase protein [Suillus clintonianus]|uniref:P-loop containing nucleoside triphosphate hydrolase protein n=1 Tax=Suillus clintonianus TaxID=1904413 RepID=UPI001B8636B9|nr:P-loop containing nucleoside triphosphate hydrolase protein [Suillus clintonianus]KAG2143088.1 P-loop containing nucleoside triphosphate hydrolase protein [Suillus clintonianus]